MNREAATAVVQRAPYTEPERKELLDMLGLLGEDAFCERHGRRHAALAPEPTADQLKLAAIAPTNINASSDSFDLTKPGSSKGRFAKIYDDAPLDRSLLPPGLQTAAAEREAAERAEAKLAAREAAKAAKGPRVRPSGWTPKPGRPLPTGGTYHPRPGARATDKLDPTWDETCGTLTGRNRHARRGEQLCDECRDYYNAYQREKKSQREKKVREPAKCGTPSGAKRHKRRGEPVCAPCLEARRADGRRQWYEREARRKGVSVDQLRAAS